MTSVKSDKKIDLSRRAVEIAAETFNLVCVVTKPGATCG